MPMFYPHRATILRYHGELAPFLPTAPGFVPLLPHVLYATLYPAYLVSKASRYMQTKFGANKRRRPTATASPDESPFDKEDTSATAERRSRTTIPRSYQPPPLPLTVTGPSAPSLHRKVATDPLQPSQRQLRLTRPDSIII